MNNSNLHRTVTSRQRIGATFAFAFALIAASAASVAFGQAPKSFEVASVKLSAPLDRAAFMSGKARLGIKIDAGRIDIATTSLFSVITAAYRLKDYQLTGPDWMKAVMVDIVAKLPAGALEDDIPEMLQTLLADRFGLRVHRETKDHPEYALVIGKGGAKLKEAVEDPEHPGTPFNPKGPDFGIMSQISNTQMTGDPSKGMVISGLPRGGTMRVTPEAGGMHIESSSASMKTLAEDLTQYLDRPVIDKTGLTKNYDVAIDVSMEDMRAFMTKSFAGMAGAMPPGGFGPGGAGGFGGGGGSQGPGSEGDAPAGSSILASLQKLGLKLDTQKSPIEVVVVDHLDRTPTEN